MTQPRTQTAVGVPSPCVSICRMDEASGWCQGCARTLPEIAAWAALGDEDKRRVWAMLPERRRQLGTRYLGPGEPAQAPSDGLGGAG